MLNCAYKEIVIHVLTAALVMSLLVNAVTLLGSIGELSSPHYLALSSTASSNRSSQGSTLRLPLSLPRRPHRSVGDSTSENIHQPIVTINDVAPIELRQDSAAPDEAAELRKPQSTYGKSALFVLYSWNQEMFGTALQSYVAAGLGPQTIILDNSPGRTIAKDPDVRAMVAEVIPTRTRLSFSQLQNFAADIAIERKYDYYFWGHSDVAVMTTDNTTSFAEGVAKCMENVIATQPTWGLVRFGRSLDTGGSTDWFLATRTDMSRSVLYDTFIPVYKSDCDYMYRVEHQGWQLFSHFDVCPELHIKTYDLKQPMTLPVHNRDRMEEMLEADRLSNPINRNVWKDHAMQKGEAIGWRLWEEAATKYFRAKWNLTEEEFTGGGCINLTPVNPETGKPEPMQPWTTLTGMESAQ